MSDSAGFGTTAIIAAALVPLVSYIKRPTWDSKTNYGVGMAAAMIAAIIGALVDGNVTNVGQALVLIATALGTSQTVYTLYFRDTAVNEKLTGK